MKRFTKTTGSTAATPPGTLTPGEPHPAAYEALKFVQSLGPSQLAALAESFASCAIEGNRLAEVCSETLRRVMHGEPVSDRYLLGLAWMAQSAAGNVSGEEAQNN